MRICLFPTRQSYQRFLKPYHKQLIQFHMSFQPKVKNPEESHGYLPSTSLLSEAEEMPAFCTFDSEEEPSQQLSVKYQEEFNFLDQNSNNSQFPQLNFDIESLEVPLSPHPSGLQNLLYNSPAQLPLELSESNPGPSESIMSTLHQNQKKPSNTQDDHQQPSLAEEVQDKQPKEAVASFASFNLDQHYFLNEPTIERSRNITKAIRKYLERHLSKYKDHFANHPDFYKKFRKQLRESKDQYFSLENMSKVFMQEEASEELNDLPRLVIRKILNRALRKEIIPNNQVKQKLTYLVSTKVYSLRCSNQLLSSRVQMR